PSTSFAPSTATCGSPGQAPVSRQQPLSATARPSLRHNSITVVSACPSADPITPTRICSPVNGSCAFGHSACSHFSLLIGFALLSDLTGVVPRARAGHSFWRVAVLAHRDFYCSPLAIALFIRGVVSEAVLLTNFARNLAHYALALVNVLRKMRHTSGDFPEFFQLGTGVTTTTTQESR